MEVANAEERSCWRRRSGGSGESGTRQAIPDAAGIGCSNPKYARPEQKGDGQHQQGRDTMVEWEEGAKEGPDQAAGRQ